MEFKLPTHKFKHNNNFLIFGLLIFTVWYLANSYFNRFSVDDFWHGFKIREMGSFENIKYHFTNWEGSISHVILASLPHVLNLESKYAFIFNILTFTVFLLSLYRLLKIILCDMYHNKKDKIEIIIITLYIVNILFLTFENKPELLFCVWLNLSYTLGLALFILGLAFYLENKIFLATLLFIFFGFNKINIAFEGLCVTFLLWYVHKRNSDGKQLIPIIAIGLAIILNIAIPGNFIRQNLIAEENVSQHGVFSIIVDNSQYYFLSFFKSLLYSFILVFPVVKYYYSNYSFTRKIILLYFALAGVFIIFESIFFAIAFKEYGPTRTKIFIEAYAVVGAIILALRINWTKFTHKIIVIYSLFFIWNWENIKLLKFIPVSIRYAESMDEREKIIKHSILTGNKLIEFDSAPPSGILNSAWLNDEEWLNYVYRRYYTSDSTYRIQVSN